MRICSAKDKGVRAAWIFVFLTCLELVEPGNVHYQYGGTWKSKQRHWDMEELVAEQSGKWEVSPQLARDFRDDWPKMVSERKHKLFQEYVTRVTYNADTEDVGIEMNREAAARFEVERAGEKATAEEGSERIHWTPG